MALHLPVIEFGNRETRKSEGHQTPSSELRRSLGRDRKRDEGRQGLVNSGDFADLPALPFELSFEELLGGNSKLEDHAWTR